ncbi:hypothetical protein M569_07596, partial [Genlisea aurea]
YPELKNEMWCHRYDLRNLCDEIKFPNWPIVEHVEFLQSLLAMWREELTRKPMDLSEEEACKILEISIEEVSRDDTPRKANSGCNDEPLSISKQIEYIDEEKLKRQYRKLAMKFHPDKNPEGREKFMAVPRAYECLQVAIQGCESSSLNGEELVRAGGIPLLSTLLSRCMCVVQPTTLASEPSATIVANILQSFSVLSTFESARVEMLELAGLIDDIIHSTELELVPTAVATALQAISHISVSFEFQNTLLKAGAMWYLIPLLLNYDSTAEEPDKKDALGVGISVQIAKNSHAVLAARALSRLSGLCNSEDGIPYNASAVDALKALLTPKLASKLKDEQPLDLLSTLNSNLETPEIIWNSSTRAELLKFVDEQRSILCHDGLFDLKNSCSFIYETLSKELYIGNVYLRVYNDQPDFEISEPEELCIALVDFISCLV